MDYCKLIKLISVIVVWNLNMVEKGSFANDSEYMRHLIRMDEERNRE
ncbi:ribbon-helix-helix domain-containing protein [Arenibacter aquaticus]|nr:hypothetical protein [Arenibacter aquaticus]